MGGPLPNMTVDHVMSVCTGCDQRGSGVPFNWTAAKAAIPAIVDCADAGNATGFLIDWEPPAHTDHWSSALMTAAAVDFASFANELAIALHGRGRRLGLDLSGDQGSPIDRFSAFAQHGPEIDYFTLMATVSAIAAARLIAARARACCPLTTTTTTARVSTLNLTKLTDSHYVHGHCHCAQYDFFDIPEKGGSKQHYNDRLMVTRALQGGIPPRKLACGIKTATLKAPNESRWNATTMGAFAHWISSLGVGGLDVWRWDIDKTWPIDATEPWLLDVLDNFIVHGADAEH